MQSYRHAASTCLNLTAFFAHPFWECTIALFFVCFHFFKLLEVFHCISKSHLKKKNLFCYYRCLWGPPPHFLLLWGKLLMNILAYRRFYVLNVCLVSKFICWNLTSTVMILGSRAFGRRIGHEGRAPMIGINAFIKEAPKDPLPPSTMWGHSRKLAACNPEGLHRNAASRTVSNKFLLFINHLVCGILL